MGKSSLFNRLVGRRLALEFAEAGTTRDRLYTEVVWCGKTFLLVDTAGILFSKTGESLAEEISSQIDAAILEADLVLFLVDGRQGLVFEDKQAAEKLRKSGKKVVFAANKIEGAKLEQNIYEFLSLGLGLPLAVSAKTGGGTGDLLDEIVKVLPAATHQHKVELGTKIAIVGKPNVGKSSLFNALLGTERAIVSDIPGTTRDVLDTRIIFEKNAFVFLDTAGLRRKAKTRQGIEVIASLKSLRAIEESDICLLVLDGTEPVSGQEQQIADFTKELGKGLIILVNKWDIVNEKFKDKNSKLGEGDGKLMDAKVWELQTKLRFVPYAPVVFVSALTHENLNEIFPLLLEIEESQERDFSESELFEIAREINVSGKILAKIKRIEQIGKKPLKFRLISSEPRSFTASVLRHIDRVIHEEFAIVGIPIKFEVEKK